MRTIALVTVIFLPGTFTATLFSVDFFDMQPHQGIVSNWIWLYVGLTLVLTLGVFLGYWLPTQRRVQQIDRLLGDTGKEKES